MSERAAWESPDYVTQGPTDNYNLANPLDFDRLNNNISNNAYFLLGFRDHRSPATGAQPLMYDENTTFQYSNGNTILDEQWEIKAFRHLAGYGELYREYAGTPLELGVDAIAAGHETLDVHNEGRIAFWSMDSFNNEIAKSIGVYAKEHGFSQEWVEATAAAHIKYAIGEGPRPLVFFGMPVVNPQRLMYKDEIIHSSLLDVAGTVIGRFSASDQFREDTGSSLLNGVKTLGVQVLDGVLKFLVQHTADAVDLLYPLCVNLN